MKRQHSPTRKRFLNRGTNEAEQNVELFRLRASLSEAEQQITDLQHALQFDEAIGWQI